MRLLGSRKWFLAALGHEGTEARITTPTAKLHIQRFSSQCVSLGLNNMLAAYDDKSAQAVCTFAYSRGPGHDPVLFQGRTDVRCSPLSARLLLRRNLVRSSMASLGKDRPGKRTVPFWSDLWRHKALCMDTSLTKHVRLGSHLRVRGENVSCPATCRDIPQLAYASMCELPVLTVWPHAQLR